MIPFRPVLAAAVLPRIFPLGSRYREALRGLSFLYYRQVEFYLGGGGGRFENGGRRCFGDYSMRVVGTCLPILPRNDHEIGFQMSLSLL